MSIMKRQREVKRKEKAARKRAKKHGRPVEGFTEPAGTPIRVLLRNPDDADAPESPRPTGPTRPGPAARSTE